MKPPNEKNLAEFWSFIAERQAVWHRRFVEKKPKPWSDDRIIRNTKFTNIYRELDPGTQFIVEEVLERGLPYDVAVFNVMLYRLIGRADTLRRVGIFDPKEYTSGRLDAKLRAIALDPSAPPIFTGAYIVAAYSNMGGKDKIENVSRLFEVIAKGLPKLLTSITLANTSEQVYKALLEQPGFGNFLAYQVLVDLRYPLRCWGGTNTLQRFSNDDWVSAGPGAMKGLAMLGVFDKDRHLQAMRWLRDHQADEFKRLGLTFHAWQGRPLDLANIQGCLCEYHKYHKVKNGTGQARASYPGERENWDVSYEVYW